MYFCIDIWFFFSSIHLPLSALMSNATGYPKVDVTPQTLFFPLPVTTIVENIIKVINREEHKVGFKIRCSAQGRYNVRPSVCFLHPKEECLIKFSVEPSTLRVDGKVPDEYCKDFFVLESRFVTSEDDITSHTTFWHPPGVEQQSSSKWNVSRCKVNCTFSLASDIPSAFVMKTPVDVAKPITVVREDPSVQVAEFRRELTNPLDVIDHPLENGSFTHDFFFFSVPWQVAIMLTIASFIIALYEEDTAFVNLLRSIGF